MSKNTRIFISILIVLIIAIGIVVIYKVSNANTTNFKFTTVNSQEEGKNYYKEIDNIKLELTIPNDWTYEEISQNKENNFYKYALKLYKNSEDQYAMLYFYNDLFGVCGTGRTSKNITLNNGKEATIGYYDENKNWADISFYDTNKYVAVINYGLINEDAEEVIQFIKTINITGQFQ